jgi:hypothetical protein
LASLANATKRPSLDVVGRAVTSLLRLPYTPRVSMSTICVVRRAAAASPDRANTSPLEMARLRWLIAGDASAVIAAE